MVIKIIEGKLVCNICGRLLHQEESFKIHEIQYEIACLDCDKSSNFSKKNYVICNTPLKQTLFNLIENARKNNKTISLGMSEARRNLVDILSTKIHPIPHQDNS